MSPPFRFVVCCWICVVSFQISRQNQNKGFETAVTQRASNKTTTSPVSLIIRSAVEDPLDQLILVDTPYRNRFED